MTAPALLGVDIGGTSIEAVVISDQLTVLGHTTIPTGRGGQQRILEALVAAGRGAMAEATVDWVTAAGVGVPGVVDPVAGSTRHAVNLGIDDALDIGPAVSATFGVPCHVENDARTAAHGAFTLARRTDPGLRSLAYVGVGTGISAGFVLDGELYRGGGGTAGEIGHVVADPTGPPCRCGLDGCLEAIASGNAAAEWDGGDGHGMSALFAAAAAGEPAAVAAAHRVAAALARALYGLVLSHDVGRIVLGGGAIRHTPALVDAIGQALAAIETASPLAADLSPTTRLSIADPTLPIGAIGAAALAGRRWSGDRSVSITS